MVKFLIERPIGVIMSFIAILMLGAVSFNELPVSLMPNIDIPEITVQVSFENISVREMENSIVAPIRRQLLQVSDVDDLRSEVRDGYGIIHLRLKYGTDNDIAFIEVNEKVDIAMRNLPKELERPRIIKASASDIPAFILNFSLKKEVDQSRFNEVSELCEVVIKKRIEQLSEVGIADITGLVHSEVYIQPNKERVESLGITQKKIQKVLQDNNVSYGNIMVHEGIYKYSIQFKSALKTIEDIKSIYLKSGGKILQLRDIAEVGIRPQQAKGAFLNGGKNAISMAIVKQRDAKVADLKKKIKWLKYEFRKKYPEIQIDIAQDQTGILDYTITNLKQSLVIGSLLAFVLMFFFLRDFRSPFLIGFSIPTSLIISLLFFHLMGLSINIISLSGLILGIGMMIDNSIIVIDNITQYRDRGEPLFWSCIKGTNEIIKPLISSVLTTCAVFLPLIFLSGISGALFYDQAVAVTVGLFSSLIVSITLLPVLYKLFYKKSKKINAIGLSKVTKKPMIQCWYEKGYAFIFKHKLVALIGFLICIPISFFLINIINKEKLPQVEQTEIILNLDWNENITVEENQNRVRKYLTQLKGIIITSNAYIGEQQFLLNRNKELGYAQVQIYLQVKSSDQIENVITITKDYFSKKYVNTLFQFSPYETLFDKIFKDDASDVVVKIRSSNKQVPEYKKIQNIQAYLQNEQYATSVTIPLLEEHIVVKLKPENLTLYEVSTGSVFERLKSAFNTLHVDVLKFRQNYLPIVITDEKRDINDILNQLQIKNAQNVNIPISILVETYTIKDFKTLYADRNSKYVPLDIVVDSEGYTKVNTGDIEDKVKRENLLVNFEGKIFSGGKLLKEMIIVLTISLLLLYFILAAQFESFTQPLIILLEIPIDIVGVILLLMVFGHSLNIMSMIGIVVMSGIIINDSILKISTINQLRNTGLNLESAIHQAGVQRLKPIIMTSLTTILALVPFLFFSDLGSELQKPFALSIIGGMTLGTLVSLYFIPLAYYFLNKNRTIKKLN